MLRTVESAATIYVAFVIKPVMAQLY